MSLKRKFEKFYNRSMPLLTVEYWYQGERYGLSKITDKSVYYNPLFVYKKNKATDVYYETTNPNWYKPLIDYFKRYPRRFSRLANQYEKECQKLLKLSKKAKYQDFSKIFNLHISNWPKLSMIISLGELFEEFNSNESIKKNQLRKIAEQAYQIRQRTDRIEYLPGIDPSILAKELLPKFKDFTNFLTFKEIVNNDIPDKNELRKRKKQYIYFNGKIHTGLNIKQLEKTANISILQKKNKLFSDTILHFRGTTAMTGQVKGRAKIVFETKHLKKINKGDILVSPMTTPDYLMAMTKASGFITDEGGITCHAAIVAREINKPCIINTKIATQFLKDGDLIDVNANQGVVRVIKRKNE
ncbi:MAG: PEP-utilizing enzyme [bacterium]